MYTYIMDEKDQVLERTNIYLRHGQREVLERIHKNTGASAAELIRRAVDLVYSDEADLGSVRIGRLSRDQRREGLKASAGAWAGRVETGEAFVERTRSGRLSRLHAREE